MLRNPDSKKESTVIFVDTFWDLMAYSTRTTRVPGIGLVLYCINKLGYLPELIEQKSINQPLIISTRGNGTEKTAFVKVHGGKSHHEHVVGLKGFPFQTRPEAFRALPIPMEVIIIPVGTKIEKIPTNLTKNTATARAAFQAIAGRTGARKDSVIIAEGSIMLTQGWEFFLPAEDSDMPYFPDENRKDIFSAENLVNAALRLHANRLEPNPVGSEGKHFILLNGILADEAVGDSSWKDKLLPAFTRRLAGKDAETIVTRLTQRMREEGWSLTIDTDAKTLPLQAISPDGIIVASGSNLANIKGRTYWKEIVIELCDGLGFETQKQLLNQIGSQKAAA